MKILIVCEYYYPERVLVTEIAERLVRDGHRVTVLTGLPNYNLPGGRVPKAYRSREKRCEEINGVQVIRSNVLGRGANKVRLLLNYFSFQISATTKAKRLEPDFDVVLCYQLTPILQMHPAIRYCQKHRKPLVCYCLDLAPESGSRIVKRILFLPDLYDRYSRWAYQQCACIAVTSRGFSDYLQTRHGIHPERIMYLPQHASPELLEQDLSKKADTQIEFLFAGNMGNGPRLDTILMATQKLLEWGKKNFRVTFIGNGSAKTKLMSMARDMKLDDHVRFLEGVPMEKMPSVYRTADALLITLRKGQITVPGKLQAYMATGKPIIGAMDGSGREMLEEAGCGICANAEDADGLANQMAEYMKDPCAFEHMGINGRRYFRKHFTLDTYITGLEAILSQSMKSGRKDREI